ncbi:MAG: hypothetical protein QXR60_04405 [Candidatus Nanoarchaeia archaeon]
MPDFSQSIQAWLHGMAPAIKTFSMFFIAFCILAPIAYYLFVVLRRKRWYVRIFEPKSDGRLYLDSFDIIEERKLKMGRKTFYWLLKKRAETTPPPFECVDHVKNKDYADYLKIRLDYVPIQKSVSPKLSASAGMTPEKERLSQIMSNATAAIKTKYNTKLFDSSSVHQRYIYAPINRVPHVNAGYHQLEYDVDMMRINAIDNLDEMFRDKRNFWERYGHLIVIGALIILVIIIGYMSFDYMSNVLKQSWDQTNAVIQKIGELSDKMGISQQKPPS